MTGPYFPIMIVLNEIVFFCIRELFDGYCKLNERCRRLAGGDRISIRV